MVVVLGAESYIGRSFCAELHRRGRDFILPPPVDYGDFDSLFDCIRKTRPEFVINAAGCVGMGADMGEETREKVLHANTILPRYVAQVSLMTNTPWGHVSSCGIYSGAKVVIAAGVFVGKKMARAELIHMIGQCPERLRGFTEADEPNFSFRAPPCNFFSGTVALAEEAISGIGRNYIWRLGLPFNERNEPENFLRQILNADKIHDGVSAYSHMDDFVRACLDLWERSAPYGIYNVANPGIVTTGQIVEIIRKTLKSSRHLECSEEVMGLCGHGHQTQPPNYILDVSKVLATGVALRPAVEAIEDALKNWRGNIMDGEFYKAAA